MLTEARAAIRAGDFTRARDALLAAWRHRRSPAIAELMRHLDAVAPDALTAQLAAIVTPRVATTLARFAEVTADDPRVATWCVDALERLPFNAASALPLYLAIAERATGDPRLALREPAIRTAVLTRIDRLPAREAIVARVRQAIADTPPLASDPDGDAIVAELTALLAPARRPVDELLAAIYAEPDDDAPRMVYADVLVELGDPRGEFIHLQLGGGDRERQKVLLKQHGKAWLGALAPVISWGKSYSRSEFRRGFLARADFIEKIDKKLPPILDDPAWSTVEEGGRGLPGELIAHAPLRALRKLEAISPARLAELARHGRSFPSLRELGLYPGDLAFDPAEVRAVFPNLAIVEWTRPDLDVGDVARSLAFGAREVVLHSYYAQAASQLERRLALFHAAVAALRDAPLVVDRVTLCGPHLAGQEAPVVVLASAP